MSVGKSSDIGKLNCLFKEIVLYKVGRINWMKYGNVEIKS